MNCPPPDFSRWRLSRLEMLLNDYKIILRLGRLSTVERAMYQNWVIALEAELGRRKEAIGL